MRTLILYFLILLSLSLDCSAGRLILPPANGPFVRCVRQDGSNFFSDYNPKFTESNETKSLNCYGMSSNEYVDYVEKTWRPLEIAIGDKTNCGLVIKIVQPIAKIQTSRGEVWFRVDDLSPLFESKNGKISPLQEFNPKCPVNEN